MSIQVLNCVGMKCPLPNLKVTVMAIKMKQGEILEVVADCSTFESDIRDWCLRARKTLLWCKEEEGGRKRIQIKF